MTRIYGLTMPTPAARDRLESDMEGVLTRAFNLARRLLFDALYREGMTSSDLANVPPETVEEIRQHMISEIEPVLVDGFVEAAHAFTESIAYGIDEEALSEASQAWAQDYTPVLVSGILDTSIQRLQQAAQQAVELILSKTELRKILLGIFALWRVATIAFTEITNAVSAGENHVVISLEGNGIRVIAIWFSRLDERVCPVCGPRHGKERGDGWQNDPPAHPRCRCYMGYIILYPDGSRLVVFDDDAVMSHL
jgi:hypothetical protein